MNQVVNSLGKLLTCGFLVFATPIFPVTAQITPDNTLGTESSRLDTNVLINNVLGDKINGGAVRESNLFHSFSEFNINDGQRVYFSNPSGVINILTRVTGGNASNILGTLGVDGNANLFLMNPNGILFGQNARLDVQGSFVGTTANGLQFGNQGVFSATNPQAPGLLTVNPSALFFNQINQNATIQNNSQALAGQHPIAGNVLGLQVPDGKSLLLVGGNVNIDGGQLNAFGGQIELGGLAEPGNINLVVDGDNWQLRFPDNVTRADVLLTNQAGVYMTGVGGGNLLINARNIDILNRSILSGGIFLGAGTSETVAGDIRLNATGRIIVTDGSRIRNLVRQNSQGQGGNITINAGSLQLRDDTQLIASTFGQGNAGSVKITATDAVSLAGKTYIFSTVEAGGVGQGGNIDIDAANLSVTDGAQLLTITRGASATQPPGKGDAGNVNVKVSGKVYIAGVKNGFSSGIRSFVDTGTEGIGGKITIDAVYFQLRDGAQLVASTFGKGDGGSVKITATDTVSLTANAAIFSTVEAGGVGQGGNIDIGAASLSVTDGAGFSTSTYGQGDAGSVKITATDAVSFTANAGIFSTVEAGGVGQGGNIDIDAANLSVTDGAQLLTITRGASATQPPGKGDAGNVNVKVSGKVDIAGVKNGFSSGIRSAVDIGTEGNGGNITIDTNSFKVRDGGLLDARTENNNQGGDITVNANVVAALNGGQLITTTSGNGSAGKITVNAKERATISANDPNYNVRLANFPNSIANIGANSGFFVSSTGSGITGDIEINSPRITLDNQGKLNAESASGNGGNININSSLLLLRRNAQISTNAGTSQQGGNGGNININSRFIVAVPGENSDISANAFTGKGGQINITTQGIFGIEPRTQASDATNDITASSQLGIQGEIAINNPEIDPTKGIIELPNEVVDATNQLSQLCPRGYDAFIKPLSSFTITGRDALPLSPLEPLQGTATIPLATLDNEGNAEMQERTNNTLPISSSPNLRVSPSPSSQIIEAQGLVKNSRGEIFLVAQAPQTTPSSQPTISACL